MASSEKKKRAPLSGEGSDVAAALLVCANFSARGKSPRARVRNSNLARPPMVLDDALVIGDASEIDVVSRDYDYD